LLFTNQNDSNNIFSLRLNVLQVNVFGRKTVNIVLLLTLNEECKSADRDDVYKMKITVTMA